MLNTCNDEGTHASNVRNRSASSARGFLNRLLARRHVCEARTASLAVRQPVPATSPRRPGTLACRIERGARGQSLVELALIAPVFLVLALGVADFGRAYFAYISLTNGARSGADYASTGLAAAADIDGVREAVLGDAANLQNVSPSNPDVAVTTSTDSQGRSYADVTVGYSFDTLFAWPGIPDLIHLERTVRARVAE